MRRSSLLFLGGASALVGGAIIIGLSIVPAPREQRKMSLDETRVQDLVAMYSAITTYQSVNKRLPASPDALPRSPTLHLADPVTGASYEYIANSLRTYRLCAVFDTRSTGTKFSFPAEASNWKHEMGHNCFSLSVPAPPASVPTTPTQR
ncbi:MAG: hypothetical protein ACRECN_08025 [Methylocella sp.]